MYLRRSGTTASKSGESYWQLVESVRTERGPRQRLVAYLGEIGSPASRLGVKLAAEGFVEGQTWRDRQLFDEDLAPEWARVDTKRVAVERFRDFGGPWLLLQVLERLGLTQWLDSVVERGQEEVAWSIVALVLVIMRVCNPSSELHIAECLYERTALEDLLGLPADKVNDDRLYRALDKILPHKAALEKHLKERLGELFGVEYDLLLYDVTSTYIEGTGASNEQMLRGYSRDQRSDCKQVCIALVVSRCGLPLGYEVFDGNRLDVTTVQEIVTKIESSYGKADRIWVMDRGMVSEANVAFLREGDRRYILGASRSSLRQFEQKLLSGKWQSVREGLDVQLCPTDDGSETFVLCRSRDRREKEKAMHERFEKRIEEGLTVMAAGCAKSKIASGVLQRRIGALLSKNSRASKLFQVEVVSRPEGGCSVVWTKDEGRRKWSELSEGCYLLRTNISDWKPDDLWKAYVQLTEAESAFRIHKSDLKLRPIWHQTKERTQAHILVCFLGYVTWKALGQFCKASGLGDEPRQIFDELAQIKMVDVVLRTDEGKRIRRRCIAEPTKAQKVLLDRMHLKLPRQLKLQEM